MKDLYIDFDGVILDTIPSLYSYLKEIGIKKNDNKEKVKKAIAKFDFKTIIKDKYIINDSINCIQKLIDSNKFNVSILTHINSLEEGIIKTKYIRRYFKDITMILVPKSISKTNMIHTKDSILVDDYSGNLREWEHMGGIGVRFSTKLNSKGFKVIDKLDKLLDIF